MLLIAKYYNSSNTAVPTFRREANWLTIRRFVCSNTVISRAPHRLRCSQDWLKGPVKTINFTSYNPVVVKTSTNGFHTSKLQYQRVKEWRSDSDQQPHISLNQGLVLSKVVLLLVAAGSIGLGLTALKLYNAYTDESDNLEQQSVFFPLWLSVNWPVQKSYPFPDYLRYIDEPYYEQIVKDRKYLAKLRTENSQSLVLELLFRLGVVRDKYGIPLTLKTKDDDMFEMWIEPKYPSFHGIDIVADKLDGHSRILWNWRIRPFNYARKLSGVIDDVSQKLNPILYDEKNRVAGNVALDVIPVSNSKDPFKTSEKCGARDYRVAARGTFHLYNSSSDFIGELYYTGVIDFAHLGINRGFRVTSLELRTMEQGRAVRYKLC